MPKKINNKIEAKGFEVSVSTQDQADYISLTDIVKYKNIDDPRMVITNWMSSYSTIDFLSLWEELNNSNFNRLEFQSVRSEKGRLVITPKQEADILNVALFGMIAKEFKAKYPDKKGNQRDHATIEQNIIMASLESSNALMIRQGLEQDVRLQSLRNLAVDQLNSVLNSRTTRQIKQLAGGENE